MTGVERVDREHERWMWIALEMADRAAALGEVPVGAVVVGVDGEIARGMNNPIASHDPSAHAEVVALREAGARLGNYRLPGTTLYVTVEPCTMCAGALLHARVERLVFGVREPKGGAVVSHAAGVAGTLAGHNHRIEVVEGVLAEDCRARLSSFFEAKRDRK